MTHGFGDWVQAGLWDTRKPVDCPGEVSNTICAIDIVIKAADIFHALNMPERELLARTLESNLRESFGKHLIDWESCTVKGSCQSSQAMGLHYGFFQGKDEEKALRQLLRFVHEKDDHLSVGVLGGRLIFRVLADYGYWDLAYHMITRADPPSYGHYVAIGATTLWEGFIDENLSLPYSRNHHFWGDISAWFYRYLGGVRTEDMFTLGRLTIRPCPVEKLTHVDCALQTPKGEVAVSWRRESKDILLTLSAPADMEVLLSIPGYRAAAALPSPLRITEPTTFRFTQC